MLEHPMMSFASLMIIANFIFSVCGGHVLQAGASEVTPKIQEINQVPSEVIVDTNTDVRVRKHPKTGQLYVSIVSRTNPDEKQIAFGNQKHVSRPDYRMLDYKTKSGEIPYDGPTSNRTKVYILAGTLAAGGVAGAALLPIAPATGAAAGGAGTFTGAGAAAAAGTVTAAALASRPDPNRDNFVHEYETRFLELDQNKNLPLVEVS